jgi:1-acyl-sn-glycerol-3-phosphate acyltransferase
VALRGGMGVAWLVGTVWRAHEESGPLAGDDVDFEPLDPGRVANVISLRLGDALRAYHRHRVRGLDHLAAAFASGRPVVLVGNHCLDLADPMMLTVAVYRALGRPLRFIGHNNIFYTVPGLRALAQSWGIIPSRHMALADACLRAEGVLMLYPGAGTEAIMRLYRREPYRLKWYGRLGFVELALRHRATLLFVAGIGIDEMYYQTNVPMPAPLVRLLNAGDAEYYQGARLQIGAAGVHLLPGILPLPVRVTHLISPPLDLDLGIDPADRAAVESAQIRLWAACQTFLDRAVAARAADSDRLDRLCRRVLACLAATGL